MRKIDRKVDFFMQEGTLYLMTAKKRKKLIKKSQVKKVKKAIAKIKKLVKKPKKILRTKKQTRNKKRKTISLRAKKNAKKRTIKITVGRKAKGKVAKKQKKTTKVKRKSAPKRIKILSVKKPKARVKVQKKSFARAKEDVRIEGLINKDGSFGESFFKAKIKVIGIGGGGGSIVSEIGRSLNKATFVIADTDTRAFKKRSGIKNFLFGQEFTHGLGTGVNPELGKLAAEKEKEKIAKLFEDQDIVIFIASLGGGLASGATQVFASAAEHFNGITFGIFTLPFKFEGKNKYKIAVKALSGLRKLLNVSITIPNERIFKVIDSNTAITDAFSVINKSLIESLESLIDLIHSPGIINIDFADLKAVLKGRGNLGFLHTLEASGKDRAETIAEKILYNPLYQNNNITAEKILFNIAGGGNLSMFEVDKISRKISEKNPRAKIIFGISKNPKLKNKIKTTLLMTGQGSGADLVVPKLDLAPVSHAAPVKIKKGKAKKSAKPTKHYLDKEQILSDDLLEPVDLKTPERATAATSKVDIIETPVLAHKKEVEVVDSFVPTPKKTIRRSGLEVKRAQEQEEKKQSSQEKEWEIPAFLRKVKFKQ